MPKRYEREIEEILRNLERPESKSEAGSGKRWGEPVNRRTDPRRRVRQPHLSLTFSFSERLLLIAIGAVLISGGYAYLKGQDLISLVFALLSVICLLLVIYIQFRPLYSRRSRSYSYQNITITPLRRDPITILRTRWNLFKLRKRYRQKNENEPR
jgi:hypothetical protein